VACLNLVALMREHICWFEVKRGIHSLTAAVNAGYGCNTLDNLAKSASALRLKFATPTRSVSAPPTGQFISSSSSELLSHIALDIRSATVPFKNRGHGGRVALPNDGESEHRRRR
jgi:hypothetical protein